jgi:hypothetical protein
MVLLAACQPASPPAGGGESAMTIEQVLARHTDSLMALPGVVGVGQGEVDGKPSVHVFVVEASAELRRRLPSRLEGYPVQVVESGVIRAQPNRKE